MALYTCAGVFQGFKLNFAHKINNPGLFSEVGCGVYIIPKALCKHSSQLDAGLLCFLLTPP